MMLETQTYNHGKKIVVRTTTKNINGGNDELLHIIINYIKVTANYTKVHTNFFIPLEDGSMTPIHNVRLYKKIEDENGNLELKVTKQPIVLIKDFLNNLIKEIETYNNISRTSLVSNIRHYLSKLSFR